MRTLVVGAVAAACLIGAGGASASTICVPPATGCDQSAGTIAAAFTVAKSSGAENTIELGAHTYSEDDLVWDGGGKLTIVGAGPGATTIQRATPADSKVTLSLQGGAPVKLTGLRVHVIAPGSAEVAVSAAGMGGELSDVTVDPDPAAGVSAGIELNGDGWTVARSAVDVNGANGDCADSGGSNEQITDSTFRGCVTGINVQGGSLSAQRVQISQSGVGAKVGDGTAVIDDALITDAFYGVMVAVGGTNASLTVRQTTIVGGSASPAGVDCANMNSPSPSTGTLDVSDSIITGFSISINASGGLPARTCDVTDDRNDYTAPQNIGQNATVASSFHMTDDPLFVDPSNGNYRLSATSSLLNVEAASLELDASKTDLDGGPRVIPAGGARDLGAYERPLVQSAVTGTASAITQSSAALAGTANTGDGVGTAAFVYGTTSAYGSQTPGTSLATSATDQAVAAPLAGLRSGVTYHYQLVVTTPYGVIKGADATFATPPGTTAPDTTPPTLTITSPKNDAIIRSSPVTISGSAADNARLASVSVSGKRVAVGPSGAWSTKVTLRPGSNTIIVVARDAAGNERKRQITVRYLVAQMTLRSLQFRGGKVLVRLACKAGGAPCPGRITVTRKGSPELGGAKYKVSAGRTTTITVGLNAKGRAMRRRLGRVTTTIVITLTQPNGRTGTFASRRLTVK